MTTMFKCFIALCLALATVAVDAEQFQFRTGCPSTDLSPGNIFSADFKKCQAIRVKECPDGLTFFSSERCGCGCLQACTSDDACNGGYCEETQCGVEGGFCRADPGKICTREYRPVCDCNGKTHSNGCVARSNFATIAYNSACEAEAPSLRQLPVQLALANVAVSHFEIDYPTGEKGKTAPALLQSTFKPWFGGPPPAVPEAVYTVTNVAELFDGTSTTPVIDQVPPITDVNWPNDPVLIPAGTVKSVEEPAVLVTNGFFATAKSNPGMEVSLFKTSTQEKTVLLAAKVEFFAGPQAPPSPYFYHTAEFHDMDGDGLLDIVAARSAVPMRIINGRPAGPDIANAKTEMVWGKQPQSDDTGLGWEETVIIAGGPGVDFTLAHLDAADKTRMQIVATEFFEQQRLVIYECATEDAAPLPWTDCAVNQDGTNSDNLREVVLGTEGRYFSVELADLNNDGQLDILASMSPHAYKPLRTDVNFGFGGATTNSINANDAFAANDPSLGELVAAIRAADLEVIGMTQQLDFAKVMLNDVDGSADLFLVFAGINNYIAGASDPTVAPTDIANAMERLYNEVGARRFLVPNLIAVGDTPLRLLFGEDAANGLNFLTTQHNIKLAELLEEFATSHPDAEVVPVDTYTIFQEQASNFEKANIGCNMEITDPTILATPGACDAYLFLDIVHPSSAAWAPVAAAAAAELSDVRRIISFGDSFSDAGSFGDTVRRATGTEFLNAPFTDSHFTDGANMVEQLEVLLNVPAANRATFFAQPVGGVVSDIDTTGNGNVFAFEYSGDWRDAASWTGHALTTLGYPEPNNAPGLFVHGPGGSPGLSQAFTPTPAHVGQKPYILVSADDGGYVEMLVPGRGDWQYTREMVYDAKLAEFPEKPGTVGSPAVGDVNGDGYADIAIPAYSAGEIVFLSFSGCRANTDCTDGLYCSKANCGRNTRGTCEEKTERCTREYEPVCGCDGMTYGNSCEAAGAGASVKHKGECPKQTCMTNVDCRKGYFCSKESCGLTEGECKAAAELCPAVFDPVCDCNGNDHSSACHANAAGENVASKGLCAVCVDYATEAGYLPRGDNVQGYPKRYTTIQDAQDDCDSESSCLGITYKNIPGPVWLKSKVGRGPFNAAGWFTGFKCEAGVVGSTVASGEALPPLPVADDGDYSAAASTTPALISVFLLVLAIIA